MSSCHIQFSKVMPCLIALGLIIFASTAKAQHADIWLILDGNQLAVSDTDLETSNPVAVDVFSGNFLFTANFADLGQGPDATDDPGFQSQAGVFNANAILNYRAIGALWFWNGDIWVNSSIDQERISITDALSSTTFIDSAGITNAEGAIGQIGPDGSVHEHIDFAVDNSLGSSAPAAGAYMIDMELFVTDTLGGSIVHTTSDPVRIAFNYQMSEAEFTEAVDSLISPSGVSVPMLPNTALLLLAILLFVLNKRRV